MMADDLNPTTTAAGDTKKSSARKLSVRKKSSARATSRASSTSSGGAGAVTAIVLTDTYGWHDVSNDGTTPRNEAFKGDKISVSKDEFERGSTTKPPGLAKVGSDEAKDAAEGKTPEPPLTKPDGHPVDPERRRPHGLRPSRRWRATPPSMMFLPVSAV